MQQEQERINKKELEAEELANCYTQLKNSVARIYEANGNVTNITIMLDKFAEQINMMRVVRYKSK